MPGFKDGLFSAACDLGDGGAATCCYSLWCPPCASSSVVGGIPEGSKFADESAVPCAGNCFGVFALNFIPGIGQCMHIYARSRARCWIRERSGGGPGSAVDCLAVTCCGPCSSCQELVQLRVLKKQDLLRAAPNPPTTTQTGAPALIYMR